MSWLSVFLYVHCFFFFFFFLMIRRPPRSTLFPYTDALPIFHARHDGGPDHRSGRLGPAAQDRREPGRQDRKSTRLNSSHLVISYAVFCLKKKNHNTNIPRRVCKSARHVDRCTSRLNVSSL